MKRKFFLMLMGWFALGFASALLSGYGSQHLAEFWGMPVAIWFGCISAISAFCGLSILVNWEELTRL